MKKRYELQCFRSGKWIQSLHDMDASTRSGKVELVAPCSANNELEYRVVQKLGRKVIKVIYPKGK